MEKKFLLHLLFIGFFSGAFSFALYWGGVFSRLELFLEDAFFSRKPISEDIIIFSIDDESLQAIGQWPWPREVFAQAFRNAEKISPRVVAADVVFADPSRRGKIDDQVLAETLREISYPLVLAMEGEDLLFRGDSLFPEAGKVIIPREEFLSSQVTLGHVNLLIDSDGVVRRFPSDIFLSGREERLLPSFAKATLLEGKFTEGEMFAGVERIPFSAPPGSFRRVPFMRLFEGDLPSDIEGKILLIGATSPDLHDEKPTSFSHGSEMPGVEIQANIINAALEGYFLTSLRTPFTGILILFSALFPAMFFFVFRRVFFALIFSVGFFLFLFLCARILFTFGIVVSLIHLLFGALLSTSLLLVARYAFAEREKREIRALFSKYVSSDVLESILSHPEQVSLGGEEREITVFFSDIRGFTTLSEKTTPIELVSILNEYFTAMSESILEKRGVLDKYIGDAIMAFWGAPIEDPLQADHAVEAALQMMESLSIFNDRLKKEKGIEIDIGIGIYTGKAVVGNVGSTLRYDYTAMGDTVNVASRLEGLNKEYKTHIIIGESTKEKLQGNYILRPLGEVLVKGRAQAVPLYSVEGKEKETYSSVK